MNLSDGNFALAHLKRRCDVIFVCNYVVSVDSAAFYSVGYLGTYSLAKDVENATKATSYIG